MSAPEPVRVLVADDQAVVREGMATVLGLLDGIEVVGVAADGAEAVRLAAAERPDVVLMDLRMPVLDGVEATRAIRAADPAVEVVVLTTYADDDSIFGALRAGARGYLTKDAGSREIARAIHAAAAGQALLDPQVQDRLLGAAGGAGAAGGTAAAGSAGAAGRPGAAGGPVAAAGGTGVAGGTVAAGGPGVAGGPGAGAARDPSTPPVAAPLPDGLTPREGEILRLIAAGLSNREIAARLVVSEATVKTHVNHVFSKTGARDRAQAVHYAYERGLAGG